MSKKFITEGDKNLWQQVAEKVKPLKKNQPPSLLDLRLNKHEIRDRVRQKQDQQDRNRPLPFAVESLSAPSATKRGTKRIERVKNITIDARIDLHGYTLDQALHQLEYFFKTAQLQGHIWVLIITGKGPIRQSAADSGGVLRQNVPLWLDHLPQVGAFATAQPQDGGSGALYVRLKKIAARLM